MQVAIINAVLAKQVEVVRQLLSAGADVNERSLEPESNVFRRTPLMFAAKEGEFAIVRLLLAHQADVHAADSVRSRRDNGGRTALHYAVQGGNISIIQELLTAGADPNAITTHGETPLAYAFQNSNALAIVELLFAAGAELVGKSNTSILSHAAISQDVTREIDPKLGWEVDRTTFTSDHRNVKLALFLLEKGASVNGTDELGCTALHYAARHGNCELIELLLDHNANPNALDKEGCTPLDRAEKNYVNKNTRTKTLALLRAAGSKRSHELREVVEARKKKKRPERLNYPSIPDFSEGANSPRFREQLSSLQTKIGTHPQPLLVPEESKWIPVPGGQVFTCSRSRIARIVEEEHICKLQEGLSVFVYLKRIHMVHTEHQIGVLPTADKYQVVLAIRPYGPNEGVNPLDIADELKKIDAIQPFHLIAIGMDQITVRFTQPMTDVSNLATVIAGFPSDVISPEDNDYLDTPDLIAECIQRTSRIIFSWEH